MRLGSLGRCRRGSAPAQPERLSRVVPAQDPRPNVTYGWPTSATTLSGRHHRRRAGWHDDDRPVRVGDVGHVNGMDVHHDQEERGDGQRADQQRSQEPGVDFDGPIHTESQHIGPGAGPLRRSKGRHPAGGDSGGTAQAASELWLAIVKS